jgi:hypothetical protein
VPNLIQIIMMMNALGNGSALLSDIVLSLPWLKTSFFPQMMMMRRLVRRMRSWNESVLVAQMDMRMLNRMIVML